MSDEPTHKQFFYNARDLWSNSGYAPYYEPDKITNLGAPVNRELVHAGFWRSYFAMRSAASVRLAAQLSRLSGAGHLNVTASVIS